MVFKTSVKLQSNDKITTFHDVTAAAREAVEKSGIKDGIAVIYSHHTTCSVITQECAFDMSMTGLETLQQDLVDVCEKIVPTCRREGIYLHPGPKALTPKTRRNISRSRTTPRTPKQARVKFLSRKSFTLMQTTLQKFRPRNSSA